MYAVRLSRIHDRNRRQCSYNKLSLRCGKSQGAAKPFKKEHFTLRTLLFQIVALLILPLILGIDGIWLSITFAELFALAVTAFLFIKYKKHYNY